ncbi:MAG: F0F1 ATP synthase subunit B [Muribaculaceae bacterium]|nr:F0F1 ATP synthase subunit B [Muribaculaceae bacterium]
MELFKPEFGLVFWMFIAFLALFLVLAKWGWPAIIEMMDSRADLIDKGVAYAQEAKAQLDSAKEEAAKLLAEARNQQADILRDAAKMKSEIVEAARAEAQVEARKVAEAAQLSIDQARKESEHQLRQEVNAFALMIAEQVLRKNMQDDAAQRQLVDRLLSEVEKKN